MALFPSPLKQKLIEFGQPMSEKQGQTKFNPSKISTSLSRNSQLAKLNRSQDRNTTMEAPR